MGTSIKLITRFLSNGLMFDIKGIKTIDNIEKNGKIKSQMSKANFHFLGCICFILIFFCERDPNCFF
jgi:hypothetical protein